LENAGQKCSRPNTKQMLISRAFRIIVLILLLFVILVAGYFYYNPDKLQKVFLPDIEKVEAVNVVFKNDSAYADLKLRMVNHSFFRLSLDSVVYNISFDNTTILNKRQVLNVAIDANDTDTLLFPVAIPVKTLQEKISDVQDRDSVLIRAEIQLMYNTKIGLITVPFDKNLTIATPRPPEFEIRKISYDGFKKGSLDLKIHLLIHNPGPIGLKISDLNYNIRIRDLIEAKGRFPDTLVVEPGELNEEILPLRVRIKKPLKVLGLILSDKDEVPYKAVIKGTLINQKNTTSSVQITKTDKLELVKPK
jgi:LEA14-like dessication related protein